MFKRLLVGWTALCFATFLAAMAFAMGTYPGYDFWGKVWCDLFSGVLPDGAPNPARAAAVTGFLALVLGSLPIWITLPRTLGAAPALCRLMTVCGVLASGAALLVPLDVGDPAFHAAAILLAGTPFFVAIGAALWLISRRSDLRGPRRLGILTIVPVTVNFLQWVRVAFLAAPPYLVLPVAQKCATIMLFFWLASLARTAFSPPRA